MFTYQCQSIKPLFRQFVANFLSNIRITMFISDSLLSYLKAGLILDAKEVLALSVKELMKLPRSWNIIQV